MKLILPIWLFLLSFSAAAEPLRVAFVYVSPVGDAGWSYSHDLGRQHLEQKFGDDVITSFVDSVPEGRKARKVLAQLAEENDIIFGTSWGYMVPMERVAAEFPNVKFEHATGLRRGDNLSTYATRVYEARYLSGMVAAAMSKSNQIGYVAAFPISEVIRGLNAFTLGAQAVKPDIKVMVEWTMAWYAPAKAKKLSHKLINKGADVLAQHTDTPAPVEMAQARGVYAIGYHSDMSAFGADSHLASVVHDWGNVYEQSIQALMDKNWGAQDLWLGLQANASKLSGMSSKVPRQVIQRVNGAQQNIKDGTLNIFAGPIKNHKGRVRIKAGRKLSDDDLRRMNWYVQGVEGDLKFF